MMVMELLKKTWGSHDMSTLCFSPYAIAAATRSSILSRPSSKINRTLSSDCLLDWVHTPPSVWCSVFHGQVDHGVAKLLRPL